MYKNHTQPARGTNFWLDLSESAVAACIAYSVQYSMCVNGMRQLVDVCVTLVVCDVCLYAMELQMIALRYVVEVEFECVSHTHRHIYSRSLECIDEAGGVVACKARCVATTNKQRTRFLILGVWNSCVRLMFMISPMLTMIFFFSREKKIESASLWCWTMELHVWMSRMKSSLAIFAKNKIIWEKYSCFRINDKSVGYMQWWRRYTNYYAA